MSIVIILHPGVQVQSGTSHNPIIKIAINSSYCLAAIQNHPREIPKPHTIFHLQTVQKGQGRHLYIPSTIATF